MTVDERIEQELKNNPELKVILESNPEKMKAYKKKVTEVWEQQTGFTEQEKDNFCRFCKTCVFSHGKPPFADLPEKAYCAMFPKSKGKAKPSDVYFEGAQCDYYEREKRKK